MQKEVSYRIIYVNLWDFDTMGIIDISDNWKSLILITRDTEFCYP